jgi:hypothetical protein
VVHVGNSEDAGPLHALVQRLKHPAGETAAAVCSLALSCTV